MQAGRVVPDPPRLTRKGRPTDGQLGFCATQPRAFSAGLVDDLAYRRIA